MKEKRPNREDILWIIGIILVLIFSVWKAHYGIGRRDASFVVQVPYRLYQGDAMFIDEQHLSQMFSFLVYPIMCLYMLFFKNTDGIILNFSYLYLFFQFVTSTFIYFRLKKISQNAALITSLVFLLFCSWNLMCLSYNTICIMCLILFITILVTKKSRIELLFVGLLYAACVLCNPYLSIVYFVISFYVFIKKHDIKDWLYITLGISILAILFIIFVMSRASLIDIIEAIPDILNDPQYVSRSFLNKTIGFIWCIVGYSYFSIVIYVLYVLNTIYYLRDKQKNRDLSFTFAVIITGIYYLLIMINDKNINLTTIPITILSFIAYKYYGCSLNKKTLLFFFAPSLFYTYSVYLSSDMGIYALGSACSVCAIFALFVFTKVFEENIIGMKKIVKLAMVIGMAMFAVVTLVYRCLIVFNGNVITIQTEKIEVGPHKGLYVAERFYNDYNKEYNEIVEIENNYNVDNILVLSNDLWIYLMADKYQAATPSSWLTTSIYINSYPERLNKYYADNPKKQPDIIYVADGFEDAIDRLDIIDNYQRTLLSTNTVIYITKNR